MRCLVVTFGGTPNFDVDDSLNGVYFGTVHFGSNPTRDRSNIFANVNSFDDNNVISANLVCEKLELLTSRTLVSL